MGLFQERGWLRHWIRHLRPSTGGRPFARPKGLPLTLRSVPGGLSRSCGREGSARFNCQICERPDCGEIAANLALNRPNRPRLFFPVSFLYVPDKRELFPCYGPVSRTTALFDQLSENKWFSADSRSHNHPGARRKRGEQGETGRIGALSNEANVRRTSVGRQPFGRRQRPFSLNPLATTILPGPSGAPKRHCLSRDGSRDSRVADSGPVCPRSLRSHPGSEQGASPRAEGFGNHT